GGNASATSGAPAAQEAKKPQIVAVVNGEPINRDELGQECLRHYGAEVLEGLVNKRLITSYCRPMQVTVRAAEGEEENDRMARKFSLPKDQWLTMLDKERNIKPAQYANDIVWPTLALRKLAAAQLTVSREELEEAYESQFGPAVKVRLIAMSDRDKATKV